MDRQTRLPPPKKQISQAHQQEPSIGSNLPPLVNSMSTAPNAQKTPTTKEEQCHSQQPALDIVPSNGLWSNSDSTSTVCALTTKNENNYPTNALANRKASESISRSEHTLVGKSQN